MYISLTASIDPVPIRMLRDTGAMQSLLAENVLPLFETTAMGIHVLLVQGVEYRILSVSLNRI